MTPQAQLERPVVLLAATATGTSGALVFAVLPVLAGQIADRFSLGDAQIGLLTSIYFSSYALISLSAPLWIRRIDWRGAALAGFATLLLGLALLHLSHSEHTIALALAIAGAGAAALLPISLALVSDMQHKERAYGIVTALQQLVPTILLLSISASWFGTYQLTTTVALIGSVVALSLFLSFALPASGSREVENANSHATSPLPAVVALIGLALNFAGFAAMWTFLERIAADNGFTTEFTTRWIAIGLLMTVVGSFIAAWIGDRHNRLLPLALPTAAAIGSALFLSKDISTTTYAVVLVVFPLSYYLALTFIISTIADADSNGRFASLMSFALACGAILGPGLFGFLRELGSSAALALVAVTLAVGVALTVWVHLKTDKNHG